MKISSSLLFLLLTLTFYSCASTQTGTSEKTSPPPVSAVEQHTADDLRFTITKLLHDTAFASSFIGIKIISVEDSVVLFDHNSGKLFHPASTMKLLTTATVLHLLPRDFRFTTSLGYGGTLESGVLNGDLWIRGSGDPLLTDSDLDTFVMALESNGITSINGNIIGDISLFDTVAWGKGWMWDDEPSSDFPFITPLTVNHNTVTIKVTGGKRSGHEPDISISPSSDMCMLFNEAVTSTDTLIKPLEVTRQHGTNRFTVSGRISPQDTSKDFTLTVWRPELFFLSHFMDKLQARNINFSGTLYTSLISPPSLTHVGNVYRGIDTILQYINKESDNLGAENLLKTIAAFSSDTIGTAGHGLAIVRNYLARAGVDTANLILADGSGVSWYNAISPDALTRLLQFEYTNATTFPVFLKSLSVAGIDGTMKNRLKGTRAEGNFRGKTGSLTGVSTISGYVTSADGKLLAVSIMCNHFPGQNSVLRNFQNAVITALAEANLSSP
jgi:D-alanyl-D-alanine carboxypeptidase/D-alanyl-D-alanine-endopeptidase (penicillin-binding protein 4)